MLNIRTVILSVLVVVVLMLTIPFVAAKTEVALDAALGQEGQVQSTDPKYSYNAASYRSLFGDCFDVPIKELAACHFADEASVQADHSPVDECFDVSLWEVASCHKANEAATP